MKTNHYIIGGLILIIFFSCDLSKEIDFDNQYFKSQIVIHGSISWENGVHAIVKKTLPPYNHDSTDNLTNPRVWLCHNNDELFELNRINEKEFSLGPDIKLNPEWGYSLKVEANAFETAISEPQFKVRRLEIDSLYLTFNKQGEPSMLRYSVKKETEGLDYYVFGILKIKNGVRDPYSFGIEIHSMNVKSNEGLKNHYISDEYDIGYSSFDSLEVSLYSVSKSLYDFGRSYDDYETSYGDHYYENVYPVVSNIKGGVGMFFSYEKFVKYIPYQKITENETN
jgi:hypothetical protein